jgi:large subunit ribosomal protein L1
LVNEKILNAIKELREKTKKKKFSQSFDLIISLKEFDLKKAENKFSEDVVLPHGKGRESSIVVFADNVKDPGTDVFTTEQVNELAKNKRKAKKLVSETDFFLAEAKLMPVVGKVLGQFVGPRGKLPKIITGDVKALVKNYKKSVRIRIKDAPVIQTIFGKEDMKDEELAENAEAVLKFLETRLPKGKSNIGKIMMKLTMGKPLKVDAYGQTKES